MSSYQILAEMLLGVPSESVSGADFMDPALPSSRTTDRTMAEILRFAI